MLICTNLIYDLQGICRILGSRNLLPFHFPYQLSINKVENIFNFSVHPAFLKHDWLYQVLLLALAAILGSYKAYFEITSLFDRFVILFFVFFAIVFIITVCFHKKEAKNVCSFFNHLVLFEGKIFDNYSNNLYYQFESLYWKNDKTLKVVHYMCKIMTCSLQVQSLVQSLSCAVIPNVSWNLVPLAVFNYFAITTDKCLVNVAFELFKRVVLFLYSYVTLRLYTNYAATNMLLDMFIPSFCLTASLKVLQRKLTWSKSSKSLFRSMQQYGQLQLLCTIYNNIHRKVLMPILIIGGILSSSGAAFILISSSSSIHFSAFLIFANLYGIGVSILFVCFYFAANFNKLSVVTLAKFRKYLVHSRYDTSNFKEFALFNEMSKRKLIRKFLRSMRPLKIKFIHGNYFDRLTPLVFFKFSMRLAINLTLINK